MRTANQRRVRVVKGVVGVARRTRGRGWAGNQFVTWIRSNLATVPLECLSGGEAGSSAGWRVLWLSALPPLPQTRRCCRKQVNRKTHGRTPPCYRSLITIYSDQGDLRCARRTNASLQVLLRPDLPVFTFFTAFTVPVAPAGRGRNTITESLYLGVNERESTHHRRGDVGKTNSSATPRSPTTLA